MNQIGAQGRPKRPHGPPQGTLVPNSSNWTHGPQIPAHGSQSGLGRLEGLGTPRAPGGPVHLGAPSGFKLVPNLDPGPQIGPHGSQIGPMMHRGAKGGAPWSLGPGPWSLFDPHLFFLVPIWSPSPRGPRAQFGSPFGPFGFPFGPRLWFPFGTSWFPFGTPSWLPF